LLYNLNIIFGNAMNSKINSKKLGYSVGVHLSRLLEESLIVSLSSQLLRRSLGMSSTTETNIEKSDGYEGSIRSTGAGFILPNSSGSAAGI
jgi:hypothetical protein